ncbi:MAG: PEGA domain-containing protein [Candidatus Firestonebacteria bacterium]
MEFFKDGKYSEALVELKQVENNNDKYYDSKYLLGKMYFYRGEYSSAIEEYNEIVANEGLVEREQLFDISIEIGEIYEKALKDYKKAITAYEKTVNIFESMVSKEQLKKLENDIGIAQTGNVVHDMVRKNRKDDRVYEKWKLIGRILYKIAQFHKKMGNERGAMEYYQKAVSYLFDSDKDRSLYELLELYMRQYEKDVNTPQFPHIIEINKQKPFYEEKVGENTKYENAFYYFLGRWKMDENGKPYIKNSSTRIWKYVFKSPKGYTIESLKTRLTAKNNKPESPYCYSQMYFTSFPAFPRRIGKEIKQFINLVNKSSDKTTKEGESILLEGVKNIILEISEQNSLLFEWNISFKLKPISEDSGTLNVTSIPDEADVWMDDKPFRSTPFVVSGIPAGKHKLEITAYSDDDPNLKLKPIVEEIEIGKNQEVKRNYVIEDKDKNGVWSEPVTIAKTDGMIYDLKILHRINDKPDIIFWAQEEKDKDKDIYISWNDTKNKKLWQQPERLVFNSIDDDFHLLLYEVKEDLCLVFQRGSSVHLSSEYRSSDMVGVYTTVTNNMRDWTTPIMFKEGHLDYSIFPLNNGKYCLAHHDPNAKLLSVSYTNDFKNITEKYIIYDPPKDDEYERRTWNTVKITQDSKGNFFATWVERWRSKEKKVKGDLENYCDEITYLKVSTSKDGKIWSEPKVVIWDRRSGSKPPDYYDGLNVFCDNKDKIYISYNKTSIYLCYSDDGVVWSNPKRLTTFWVGKYFLTQDKEGIYWMLYSTSAFRGAKYLKLRFCEDILKLFD